MKIVYLYSSLAVVGGVERILVDKMNYLVRECGEEVYIITSDQGMHRVPYQLDERVHFMDMNIRFHTQYQYDIVRRQWIRWWMNREYDTKLRKALAEIQPDIIVCMTAQHVRRLLRVKGHIPLVVESHVNFSHIDSRWHLLQNRMNNYWIGKAEAVVTLTEGDAKDWRRVSKHVHVIPNMVHLNESGKYSECVNKRAVFVGRLVEQKGLPELLKVWQLVHKKYPDWQLDIYGEGNMFNDQCSMFNVHIHPPVSNIFEKYMESSMLLLTSVYEPFGLVMPEAMSCGIPVVAFDSPHGPATIITDGEDGFLVGNRDSQVFADRVCQLIEDQELRQRMGRKAVQSSQRFTADKIMPQWKALFSSLTSKEPSPERKG